MTNCLAGQKYNKIGDKDNLNTFSKDNDKNDPEDRRIEGRGGITEHQLPRPSRDPAYQSSKKFAQRCTSIAYFCSVYWSL